MRYGLLSNLRRSWSKKGERALINHQHKFANSYCFSAVDPITGDSFHLTGLPTFDSQNMHLFLTEMKKKYPDEHIVMVMDNAPCHRPKWVQDVSGITIVFLPPYSPQLNPAERFFEELRKSTANKVFETIEAVETVIDQKIKDLADDLEGMKKLLGYPWILEQCVKVL